MPKILQLNQKGFTSIITLVLILVGIVASVYLVQHAPLIFQPKAAAMVLDIQKAEGNDESGQPCRVYEEGGIKKTNCKNVTLNILSPQDVAGGVTTPQVRCADNPVAPLDGYKWVADCSKTCETNDNCPKNSVQGPTGFVCPATSNYCYDFKGDVGKKCLMLEYIGPKTGGPVGRYSNLTCDDKTRLTYSCIQGPAGTITVDQADCVIKVRGDVLKKYTEQNTWCNTKDNLRAIVNDWYNKLANSQDKDQVKSCFANQPQPSGKVEFVVAESEGELQANTWEEYKAGGVLKTYTFTPANRGTKYILVRFRQGSTLLGDNFYREIIEYVPPTATQPSASPSPSPAGGSTADTNLPGVLYVGDLRVAPTSVRKDSSGNYSKVRITVIDANKPWQLYYQNKAGANCGGTCDLEGWISLNALQGAEGGVGNQGTTSFAWTPQSGISGVHTIALVDVQASRVIKSVDVNFGGAAGTSTRSTTQISVSPNPVIKDSSGRYPIITVNVKNPDRNWTIFYNEQGCGNSCDPKVGWTPFSQLTTGGTGNADRDASFTWAPYSWISGTHTFAIVDTNTNQVIAPTDVSFHEYGYVPTRTDD